MLAVPTCYAQLQRMLQPECTVHIYCEYTYTDIYMYTVPVVSDRADHCCMLAVEALLEAPSALRPPPPPPGMGYLSGWCWLACSRVVTSEEAQDTSGAYAADCKCKGCLAPGHQWQGVLHVSLARSAAGGVRARDGWGVGAGVGLGVEVGMDVWCGWGGVGCGGRGGVGAGAGDMVWAQERINQAVLCML